MVSVFQQETACLGRNYVSATYTCLLPVATTMRVAFRHLSCIRRCTEVIGDLHLPDLELEMHGPQLAHRQESQTGVDRCRLASSRSSARCCCYLHPPRRRLCDHVVTSTKAEVMRSCRYLHQGGGYVIMSLPPPRRRLCDHVVTSTEAEVMRSCRYLHQGGGYVIMSLPPPRRRLCDHVVTSTKAEVMRSCRYLHQGGGYAIHAACPSLDHFTSKD